MTSPITVTALPYTGTTQFASVDATYGLPVTAHMWGGAGGSSAIFSGAGGGYSVIDFIAKPGDVLTVAVGQGGGAGGNSQYPYTPLGRPGASYIGTFFNTRFPPAQDLPVYPYGNGDTFLGQYGVWGADPRATSFTRTYVINFPTTANVIFQMVASIYGRVYLDYNLVVEGAGYVNNKINQASLTITAGTHVLTIEGTGQTFLPWVNGANSIAVTLSTGDLTSYSGGRGGQTDSSSPQGYGGGGGGATVLSLNGVVIGTAAGGGGGAARAVTGDYSTAPITDRSFNGQNGQDVFGYTNAGGGGGGGGGGARGGQGGAGTANGANNGYNGTSLGKTTVPSVGQIPYSNEYYPGGGVAFGGGSGAAGGNGYIALVYQTGGGGYVNVFGTWAPVQQTYVNDNGVWKPVNTVYVNSNGIWKPIQGAPVPTFALVNGAFGALSRTYSGALVAPPPAPSYDYSGYTGYGDTSMF